MLDRTRLEQAAHLQTLRELAHCNAIPEDTALALYERERLLLDSGARVKQFVGILAEKRARRALRQMKR